MPQPIRARTVARTAALVAGLALSPVASADAQPAVSTSAGVTISVTVPPRATITHAESPAVVARDGEGAEYAASLVVRANTTWVLFARVRRRDTAVRVRAADGSLRTLAAGEVVAVARGAKGESTVPVRFVAVGGAPDAPAVEYTIALAPAAPAW